MTTNHTPLKSAKSFKIAKTKLYFGAGFIDMIHIEVEKKDHQIK